MVQKVISVDILEAKWVYNSTRKPFIFTNSSLKRFNKCLINNWYFKLDRPFWDIIISTIIQSQKQFHIFTEIKRVLSVPFTKIQVILAYVRNVPNIHIQHLY